MATEKTKKEKDKKSFPFDNYPQYVRSEAVRELFEIKDGELPMKTNTPARVLLPFVLMEVAEEGLNLTRSDRLSKVFRDSHDKRMISRGGKGRAELLAALQTMMREEGAEELGI